MQDEKAKVRVRRASPGELRLIARFLSSIGLGEGFLRGGYSRVLVLEVERGPYREVFLLDTRLADVAEALGAFYSGGLNLGIIDREGFKPSLHLARILAPLCRGSVIKCSVVNPRGAELFLYGREVFEENIVRWVRGVSLVVGVDVEPLGWGLGVEERGMRVIKPLKDLGWYLRRGG